MASMLVGQLDPAQLETFRALALATVPQVRHGQLQVDAWVTANINFHAYLPSVSGNAALQQAYERLSITDFMLRAVTTETSVSPRVAHDHLDLVEAYERGDLARARDIIIGHNARAKKKHAGPARGTCRRHDGHYRLSQVGRHFTSLAAQASRPARADPATRAHLFRAGWRHTIGPPAAGRRVTRRRGADRQRRWASSSVSTVAMARPGLRLGRSL